MSLPEHRTQLKQGSTSKLFQTALIVPTFIFPQLISDYRTGFCKIFRIGGTGLSLSLVRSVTWESSIASLILHTFIYKKGMLTGLTS